MLFLKRWLPLIFFIFLCATLGSVLYLRSEESNSLGKKVPDFIATAILGSPKKITNQLFLGHVSMLNVFASWCVSCKKEHNTLLKLHETYANLAMYGLAFKDKPKAVKAWLKNHGNPYRIVINDESGMIAQKLGVYVTPVTFLINRKGIIFYKQVGPIDIEKLKVALSHQLKMNK